MSYIRKGVVPVEDVFKEIEAGKKTAVFHDEPVGLSSLRIKTFFHKGVMCTLCNNLRGEFFAVERHEHSKSYHLNLYGYRNGKEVLFTKDHIHAKAKGGEDSLENMQTACRSCNQKKADK